MKALVSDCHHALRLYRRTPGASLMAVFVLAIGMAFVGAFLSLYVDLILRPHPGFEQSGRLATVGQTSGRILSGVPVPIVERMAEEMASVEAAATALAGSALIGEDRERVRIEMVSGQFFDGLRPRLALGDGFRPAADSVDAEPVVVISYRLWQSRFGGDPAVIGTALDLSWDPSRAYLDRQPRQVDGRTVLLYVMSAPERQTTAFRIVGVMARSLPGLAVAETELWVPLQLAFPLLVADATMLPQTTGDTFVRRPARVSASAVLRELESRFADEIVALNRIPDSRLDASEGVFRNINIQRDTKRQLLMFLTGSVLLALVAGANVSLFLLARAPGRRRELGIRLAVGAPWRRIARQLATEAGLLVVISAILGLLASVWLGMFLRGLALIRNAEWRDVTLLDWRVLGLAAVFILGLTLLVALAPIVGLKRAGIAASSRQVSGRASPAQRLAGTVQLAIAGALGGVAIAFAWYLGVMMFGNPGYELANRYLAQTNWSNDNRASIQRAELPRRREIIEALPGVDRLSFGEPVPGTATAYVLHRVPQSGDPATMVEVMSGRIDSRFIDVLGLRLAHGRSLGDDEQGVLINQSMARAVWGRDDVVGELLPAGGTVNRQLEVVGVLEDMSYGHPAAGAEPLMFMDQESVMSMQAVIESRLTAAALQQELDRLTTSGALDGTVSNIRPLRQPRNDLLAPDRARAGLTIVTGALVVLLAAFGYYGTQRYLVAAGRREYAIRASLGAGPRALGRLVVSRGLLMSLPGLVLGGLLAFIAVAWLRSDFLGDKVSPAIVMVAVVAGLAVLLLAATRGPAGEARRTQPAPLLREDGI